MIAALLMALGGYQWYSGTFFPSKKEGGEPWYKELEPPIFERFEETAAAATAEELIQGFGKGLTKIFTLFKEPVVIPASIGITPAEAKLTQKAVEEKKILQAASLAAFSGDVAAVYALSQGFLPAPKVTATIVEAQKTAAKAATLQAASLAAFSGDVAAVYALSQGWRP